MDYWSNFMFMFFLLKPQTHAWMLAGLLVSATAIATEHKAYIQFNAGAAFAKPFKFSESSCSFFGGCDTYTYKEDYDTGYVAGIAMGYRVADRIRLDVEGSYQGNNRNNFQASLASGGFHDTRSGSLNGERERSAFLINGYYDFKNSTAFTPFLTGGVGGYHLHLKVNGQGVSNDLDFAWQVGAGLNYKLDDQISFDLKYRYFGGADANLTSQASNSISRLYEVGDHQAMAGIRIGF
jgi:opacity protein-like surface antigen